MSSAQPGVALASREGFTNQALGRELRTVPGVLMFKKPDGSIGSARVDVADRPSAIDELLREHVGVSYFDAHPTRAWSIAFPSQTGKLVVRGQGGLNEGLKSLFAVLI